MLKSVSDFTGEVIEDETHMVMIVEDGVEYRLKDLAEAKQWFLAGKPRLKKGGVMLVSDWSGEIIVDESKALKVRYHGQDFVFKDADEAVAWWQEQMR